MKREHITELEDEKWLMKLAFLCDITAKLNDLNLNLQGKNKCLTGMTSVIKTFKETIKRYASQLRKHDLRNFKNMEEECIHNPNRDFENFAEHLDVLFEEFERRFADLISLEEILNFMIFPFNENVNIDEVSEKVGHLIDATSVTVEEEIIKLRCDIFLKSRVYSDTDFWKLISEETFPNIYKLILYLKSYFGSTYLCESAFSTMNAIKTKHRSRLTDKHLISCLRIAISSYQPQ